MVSLAKPPGDNPLPAFSWGVAAKPAFLRRHNRVKLESNQEIFYG
jgi:hypothetical protein